MWEPVNNCEYHVAAVQDDNLLLWENQRMSAYYRVPRSSFDCYNPRRDQWTRVKCTGRVPPRHLLYAAQVIANKLYMIELDEPIAVYVLDLRSNHWKKLENLAGIPPLSSYSDISDDFASSWVWKDKIYLFGGYGKKPGPLHRVQSQVQFAARFHNDEVGWNNQCVAFNTTTEAWEWPRTFGVQLPCPRFNQTSIVDGDYMLLFGGYCAKKFLNDLHALHLPSHTWTSLCAGKSRVPDGMPKGRCLHSFTSIGENRAILLGGENKQIWTDCWVLSWSTGISGIENAKWNQWKNQDYGRRYGHRAVYTPDSSRIYLFGGLRPKSGSSSQQSSLVVNPETLFDSSTNVIIKNRFDLSKVILPVSLKAVLEDKLSSIK